MDLVVTYVRSDGITVWDGMSILLSLGAGWPIPPLDQGVTMRALQTPIWWPLHWYPGGRIREGQLKGYELILCHGRRMLDKALGLVIMS